MKIITKKNKIIYLTTNSGYGVGEKNKYCDEDSPLNPISLYGRTKVTAEKIVMNYKNTIASNIFIYFYINFSIGKLSYTRIDKFIFQVF